jgi:predicted HD phosphohydrolase
MRLVTIEQARQHCRADSDDDQMLTLYGGAAEDAAQDFLNRRVYEDEDALAAAVLAGAAGCDPIVVNDAIRAAVLLTLGHLYANRENVVTGTIVSEMKEGTRSLLWPYRIGLGV